MMPLMETINPLMDALHERLTRRPSKALILSLAREAMADTKVLDALFLLIYRGEEPCRWRAAWVISKVSEQCAELVASQRSQIVREIMALDASSGLQRLLLGIYYNMPEADELDVEFFNFLLDRMGCLQSPPGVQALAVKVAARMSRIDDALYEEFLCILRNMELGYYSAGVRAAVRNCLKYKSKVK